MKHDSNLQMRLLLMSSGAQNAEKNKVLEKKSRLTLDDAADGDPDSATDYTTKDIALKATNALHEWTETDDLDEGETLADRLTGLIVGIADANQDGEIDADEQSVIDVALNAAWDYLSQSGVDESDISSLLEDWDAGAAERVRDHLVNVLPQGEDAAQDDIDDFVFGSDDDDQDAVFDAATYKKKIVFKHGKKTKVNKRIAGHVKLSGKQKLAIRKMLLKSHSAGAQVRRAKSVKMRSNSGM